MHPFWRTCRPRRVARFVHPAFGFFLGLLLQAGNVAAAGNLLLSDGEREWVRAHPAFNYAIAPTEADADAYRQQAADYVAAVAARVGLRAEMHPLDPGMDGQILLDEGRIDVLIRHLGKSALAGRRPPLQVRTDLPVLAGLLAKGHAAFAAGELADLPALFPDALPNDAARISSEEYASAVTLLAAGSASLILLVWWWSVRRRQRLAREIERNEALFDAFFSASPAGMAILDRELRFVRINAPLAALHGVPTASHAGRTVEQVLPELAATVAPLMREVLLDGRSIRNVEVAVHAPSRGGEAAHWLVSFFPIPAPHGRNPLGVGEVVVDIGDRKRAELALEKSRAELRRLGAHREGMVEREHQRLAREFHDELGQLLTTARMHLQLLTRLIDTDPAQAKESVRAIDAMIVDAYRSIKTIASDLRPAALNLGLVAAIEWQADRMLRPAGIVCAVDCMPETDRLDEDSAITLFRIVQESLTNIVRHAAATRVVIAIRRAGDGLRLVVEDNGKGFDQARVDRVRQFGLLGMAERVAALGGDLDLDSAPGKGTRVVVTLPRMAAHLASPSPTEPTLAP